MRTMPWSDTRSAQRNLTGTWTKGLFLIDHAMIVQENLKAIKKEHGSKVLGSVTVDMAIGGMRGIPVSPETC